MANIVIKDLEMDKELDNVSLLEIIGGCYRRRRICISKTVAVYKTVLRRHTRLQVWYTRHRVIAGYRSVTVCFWR
jgi:hypothetical protein